MKLTDSNGERNPMLRKILIRAVLYTVVILGMSWYLNRFAPRRKTAPPHGTPVPAAPAASLAGKPAEFRAASRQPLVVLLSLESDKSRDYESQRAALTAEYGEGYSVIHATVNSADEAKQYFQVEKLPALLVFDADNQEIKRQEDYPVPALSEPTP